MKKTLKLMAFISAWLAPASSHAKEINQLRLCAGQADLELTSKKPNTEEELSMTWSDGTYFKCKNTEFSYNNQVGVALLPNQRMLNEVPGWNCGGKLLSDFRVRVPDAGHQTALPFEAYIFTKDGKERHRFSMIKDPMSGQKCQVSESKVIYGYKERAEYAIDNSDLRFTLEYTATSASEAVKIRF